MIVLRVVNILVEISICQGDSCVENIAEIEIGRVLAEESSLISGHFHHGSVNSIAGCIIDIK